MYSSTLPSTSALDGGGWSKPRPGRFTPGKDPVPIVQYAGWVPGPVWTDEKMKVPGILDFFLVKLEFSPTGFSKNNQIPNLIKILQVGAELFLADRQTDRHDKARSRFSLFCECA